MGEWAGKCRRDSEGKTVQGVQETRTASASPTEEGQDACPHITPGLSDNVRLQTNLLVKRRSIQTVHKNNNDYKILKLAECEKYTGWVGGEHHLRTSGLQFMLLLDVCRPTLLHLIKTIYIIQYKIFYVICFANYLRELHLKRVHLVHYMLYNIIVVRHVWLVPPSYRLAL